MYMYLQADLATTSSSGLTAKRNVPIQLSLTLAPMGRNNVLYEISNFELPGSLKESVSNLRSISFLNSQNYLLKLFFCRANY